MTNISAQHETIRAALRVRPLEDEGEVLQALINEAALSKGERKAIGLRAEKLVRRIRGGSAPGLMELFLGEYGLTTEEGVALMCLAEALLRVPDAETIDALIKDKIAPSKWANHLGQSCSPLVNASTWGLMLTGAVLSEDAEPGIAVILRKAVKRLGEPVIRTAVTQAMRELGKQFVLGQTVKEAVKRTTYEIGRGYTYSFDMLGEAAQTRADARRYHLAYSEAITALAKLCLADDVSDNPGISVKLSALHPRYEPTQKPLLMEMLVPRVRSLALLAKSAGMGFNIDAEEAHRLNLSLDIIEAVLGDPALAGWDGFGVVVQAYDKRAPLVIDWLYALATRLDRRLMVRLVKGAYWDTEIKRAQALGVKTYPVFTRKASTDVCFIACARKLFNLGDRIYPQFATHNAHTAAAVMELSEGATTFEFQRLHGMGEALYDVLVTKTRSRIYAPVGSHKDLLAYLVRRLLENGSNSSFVNQIVDKDVPVERVAADPFGQVEEYKGGVANPNITPPPALYGETRRNSAGWDILEPYDRLRMEEARNPFKKARWCAAPLIAGSFENLTSRQICNPANETDIVGEVFEASPNDIKTAIKNTARWQKAPEERAGVLNRASDLFETHAGELFALLTREAGKTPFDAIGEIREAVDFLRFYASEQILHKGRSARGIFTCISPWNFPLAIFTGQIAAALAAGNGVIAKPAERTSLIAHRAVQLLHDAGVPIAALQLCPGKGSIIGAPLTADPRIGGVCFTGGMDTARHIHRNMAGAVTAAAPLIAETGGLNAMIVDSTALPEQAVRDIIASAFQSAGQRCSALRILYVQDDVADDLLTMLFGAMDMLNIGNPWEFSTDVGPVIDNRARDHILAYIGHAEAEDRVLKKLQIPEEGLFVPPCAIAVTGIEDMAEEIFGPVLHVARFAAGGVDAVIDAVNGAGYGLTFGLHTRIDDRIQHVIDRIHVGNIYVNRNQIGAIVGSQPFGGEGLSGTGPKAGGPYYVPRFFCAETPAELSPPGVKLDAGRIQAALDSLELASNSMVAVMSMPGPTGESNRLGLFPRGRVLCLGPRAEDANIQTAIVEEAGCTALAIAPGIKKNSGLDGYLDPSSLIELKEFDAVVYWGEEASARAMRCALAARSGPVLPLIREREFTNLLHLERHVCVDITATGGNAALLAESAGEI